MTGPDVAELMLILVANDYLEPADLNTDQRYTNEVEAAVKSFQRASNLTEDGRVGPMTAVYLKRLSTQTADAAGTLGSRALTLGMTGPDVAELMLVLTKLGHLEASNLNTEQRFTGAVEEAVKRFQRANGLTETGRVDAITALRMKSQS